ncbi:hypothetical protein [Frankia sp. Cppng1_Ct_nod]|uniref:hypothetical protein n=1 Tax=Frankia sp. Cppng1_Ct_nod TaxID=2897162 RepID=UPI0013EFBCC0|nr:hypothetical protein [Frankia sp. Cppng1_Ct_nod]
MLPDADGGDDDPEERQPDLEGSDLDVAQDDLRVVGGDANKPADRAPEHAGEDLQPAAGMGATPDRGHNLGGPVDDPEQSVAEKLGMRLDHYEVLHGTDSAVHTISRTEWVAWTTG